MDGIINVYKERGFTSHDVVAKLRGILKQKKIGHTGTLDPDAVGVLPVCLGKATKVCELLTDHDKTYRAVLRLGIRTDTQDMTGTVLQEKSTEALTETAVREAILSYVGEYDQIPPMYSALKVNGKKLYELARAGKEVERAPRRIRIHEIRIESVTLPTAAFLVTCSKGTYIRTLCQDIGETLQCGGCMQALERTRVGCFTKETAHSLDEIQALAQQGSAEKLLIPVDTLFQEYPGLTAAAAAEKRLYNGNFLEPQDVGQKQLTEEKVRIYDQGGAFIGIYQPEKTKGVYKPVKLFL